MTSAAVSTLRLRPRSSGVPEAAALTALFLLYSNAIVVAVTFHGVPAAIAIVVPLLLAFPVGVSVLLRGDPLILPPALVWIFALVVVQFIGCLFAVDPISSLGEFATSVAEGLILYLLVVNAFRDEGSLRRATWVLLAAGGLMGGLVLYQQLTGRFDQTFFGFAQVGSGLGADGDAGPAQRRLAGPIGEVNRFGQIMAVLLPLGLFGLGLARSALGRVLVFGALLLTVAGVVLSFSRGVAVGLGMAFAVLVALRAVSLRAVAVAVLAVALAAVAVPQYGGRLTTMGEAARMGLGPGPGLRNADGAIRGRLTEMMAGALIFADHPLVGAGPGMASHHYREYAELVGGRVRDEERPTHNLYLGLAAEHGLLGLLAFAGLVGTTWRDLRRAHLRWSRERPGRAALASAFLGSLIVYLMTSLFQHAAYVRYFWVILALGSAAGVVLGATGDRRVRNVTGIAIARPDRMAG